MRRFALIPFVVLLSACSATTDASPSPDPTVTAAVALNGTTSKEDIDAFSTAVCAAVEKARLIGGQQRLMLDIQDPVRFRAELRRLDEVRDEVTELLDNAPVYPEGAELVREIRISLRAMLEGMGLIADGLSGDEAAFSSSVSYFEDANEAWEAAKDAYAAAPGIDCPDLPQPSLLPPLAVTPTPTLSPTPISTPTPSPKPTTSPTAAPNLRATPARPPIDQPADVMFDPDDPYLQTWPEPYSETDCADWNTRMTREQRFTAAADMLTAARNGDGLDFANDATFLAFGVAISEACLPPAEILGITEVATSLYLLSDDFK